MYEPGMTLCREKAAQAWCTEQTKNTIMDPILAEEFAKILYHEIYEELHLGTVTTEEMLIEIRARLEVSGQLHYKTVGAENEIQG